MAKWLIIVRQLGVSKCGWLVSIDNLKMLTKEFVAYTKVLGKYVRLYDIYIRSFEDFLLTLDKLWKAGLTYHIMHSSKLDIYIKAISYDLQNILPIYQLFFQCRYNPNQEPHVSSTNYVDKLLVQIPMSIKHVLQVPLSLALRCTD